MKKARKILLVFGTRPEAIKMAPVVRALKQDCFAFEVAVCVTAQHRQLLDQVLEIFDIVPDFDLDLMRTSQSPQDITAGILQSIGRVYDEFKPDIVLVHGDTNTCFAAALAAFYQQIKVAHVEAGLRTGDNFAPWPEEMNRKLTASIAQLHFAPTAKNRDNLLNEGIAKQQIFITGNTIIDALKYCIGRIENDQILHSTMKKRFGYLSSDKRLILVTAHRHENFGDGLDNICHALLDMARCHNDIEIIFPVHPNPNVMGPVHHMLSHQPNIHLVEPIDYLGFCYLLKLCFLVLTDSGGLQEEAPSLGKPVLLMRDTSERPEAVSAGNVLLVATDPRRIVKEVSTLLNDEHHYAAMAICSHPYGDGNAAKIIAEILKETI